MVFTPDEYDAEMLDEMHSGNLVEREAGRDKFVTATLIAKHGEGRDPGEAIPSLAELAAPTVQCVKINCNNDLLEGEEKFVLLDILATDERFRFMPTEFSIAMGLPLIVDISVTLSDRKLDPHGLMNRTGAYFYRPVDPKQKDFGLYFVWVSAMMSVGSVIIFRQDKKHITMKQVQALAHYVRYQWDEEYRLLTRIAYGKRERKVLRYDRKAFIEKTLSRAAFESFFESFKESRGSGDPSWFGEISPYEM